MQQVKADVDLFLDGRGLGGGLIALADHMGA
jgi:hypothetical protein